MVITARQNRQIHRPGGGNLSSKLPYFRCSIEIDGACLQSRLAGHFELVDEGGGPVRLTYYDTFDGRLHNAGLTLYLEQPSRRPGRLWCALPGDDYGDHQEVITVPRFADQLPAGPLRTRLHRVAGIRALLALVALRGRRHRFGVRNEDGKTVARCYLERWRPAGRGHAQTAAVSIARLEPLRGYDAETGQVADLLRGEGMEPARGDVLEIALELVGRERNDYSSKLRVRLRPGEQVAVAVRRLLDSQLQLMRANEAGVKQNLDTEFLHDFRVAVRRSRSLLSQIKGIYAEPALATFREEFAWLGTITSSQRDLDVHLLQFPDQQSLLAAEQRADLLPLRQLLEQRQAAAHNEVVAALKSARYRHFLRRWQAFLETNGSDNEGPNAKQPVVEVASKRIWRVYRRVRREGRAITDASPPAELHELRKSCKRLRYLMEFFQTLYPRKKIRRAISHLKDLQENLGDFQDQTVQMDSLRSYSDELTVGSEVPVPTLLVIGALMDRIAHAHRDTRNEFARRFSAFNTPANHRLFRGLFRTSQVSVGHTL